MNKKTITAFRFNFQLVTAVAVALFLRKKSDTSQLGNNILVRLHFSAAVFRPSLNQSCLKHNWFVSNLTI
jgi:hypothetical protein